MKDPTRRFDAWGNPILPHDAMKAYYREDPESLRVLSQCMPHMFVVIPDVMIEIITGDNPTVLCFRTFPGGSKESIVSPSVRVWEALRRTWRGKPGWKHEYRTNGVVILRRKGKVIYDPAHKFFTPR